jgi:hypothetical protein
MFENKQKLSTQISRHPASWSTGSVLDRIREVFGSNPGRDTGDLDLGFSWLSSVPPEKYQKNTSIRLRPLPPKSSNLSLTYHYYSPSSHSLATDSVEKKPRVLTLVS